MKRFQQIVILLLSVTILWVGVPRFLAALWMAIGAPIYGDISKGKPVSKEDIEFLIETRQNAIKFYDDPRAYTDLALAMVALNPGQESIKEAVVWLEKGLELKPVAPFAWLRLADYYSRIDRAAPEGVQAWVTSRNLARYERFIMLHRVRVGAQLYGSLNEEQRAMLLEDANFAYELNRYAMREYGQQNNMLHWFVFLLRDPQKSKFLMS